jgi:glycosyltransferase involved in cell wall biosynthesis
VKKKICIITHTHLCRNPRVLKEALCLYDAGFNISILNSIWSEDLYLEDLNLLNGTKIRIKPVSDLIKKDIHSFLDRLLKKIGILLNTYFKVETMFALGYAPLRYLSIAMKESADLYICHQELPTYIGSRLLKKRKNVAFDLEDWYSEDLLPENRKERPLALLKKLEKLALSYPEKCWTTSHSMAKAMSKNYGTPLPQVIYNVFPSQHLTNTTAGKRPIKLFWFSQTIGRGRGLEEIISILKEVNSTFELHLLGDCTESYKTIIKGLAANRFNITFHVLQPTHLLSAYIEKFDLGLALELNEPLSRRYTITNKLFQYLQAGLPVVATDTSGQQEIIRDTEAGLIINLFEKGECISRLELLLNDAETFCRYRQKAIEAAKKYNWEVEKTKLLFIISEILPHD